MISAPKPRQKGLRQRIIAQIHIACAQLGIDTTDPALDCEYRQMLFTLTRQRSCAKIDLGGLHKVLAHLKSRGWKNKAPRRAQPGASQMDDHPQSKMIRGLWIELADTGLVHDRSERALAAFVKRQTGVEQLAWLNGYQASLVIEALKSWLARAA